MHDDAERMARRFVEVRGIITGAGKLWEIMSADERRLYVETFDELLRAEVFFPGPSLYADG